MAMRPLSRRTLLTGALLAGLAPGQTLGESAGRTSGGRAGTDAFRRAEGTRVWAFPRDHGQHPDYRLEWWYYTGVLRTAGGRRFGYQVTFFRQGLSGASAERPSAWATHSLYLAHVALSDVEHARYLRDLRTGRDSLGVCGAADARHTVWLRDWRADALEDDPHGAQVEIAAENFALSLNLRAGRPPLLHGAGGLDRKGAQPGEASWYYSQPRLRTTGTLRMGEHTHAVRGETWMDHEFGTGQLADELVGWDWLALRLDDGSDLMLYRLRRRDGSASPYSGGTLVGADGRITSLWLGERPAAPTEGASVRAELAPQPAGHIWHSPATGADYPLEWTVNLPAEALTLRVRPAFDAQEQASAEGTSLAYWEGLVDAEGSRSGRTVRGEGYLELTGYAGALGGALRR